MSKEKLQTRIAWGITGAGHFLSSSLELLMSLNPVDIYLSQAAKEVLSFYGWYNRLTASGYPLFVDTSASCVSVTKLYTGEYNLVVIAPVTSNSIAKMVNGVADNLVTNLFAHAGKCNIRTVLLPCDTESEIKSITPKNEQVLVHVRKIDRENIERLASWDNVTIASDPQQLIDCLKNIQVCR